MISKGFPNVITYIQQYNIGEEPTVRLYADIHHHVGTMKQKQKNTTRHEFRSIIYMDLEF